MDKFDGLTITIAGKHDRGKTTTARLIEEALKENGYTDVKLVEDPPPVTDKDRFWERFQKTRARPVRIRVENVEPKSLNCSCGAVELGTKASRAVDGQLHSRSFCEPDV